MDRIQAFAQANLEPAQEGEVTDAVKSLLSGIGDKIKQALPKRKSGEEVIKNKKAPAKSGKEDISEIKKYLSTHEADVISAHKAFCSRMEKDIAQLKTKSEYKALPDFIYYTGANAKDLGWSFHASQPGLSGAYLFVGGLINSKIIDLRDFDDPNDKLWDHLGDASDVANAKAATKKICAQYCKDMQKVAEKNLTIYIQDLNKAGIAAKSFDIECDYDTNIWDNMVIVIER